MPNDASTAVRIVLLVPEQSAESWFVRQSWRWPWRLQYPILQYGIVIGSSLMSKYNLSVGTRPRIQCRSWRYTVLEYCRRFNRFPLKIKYDPRIRSLSLSNPRHGNNDDTYIALRTRRKHVLGHMYLLLYNRPCLWFKLAASTYFIGLLCQ